MAGFEPASESFNRRTSTSVVGLFGSRSSAPDRRGVRRASHIATEVALGSDHGAPSCTSTFRRLSLTGRGSAQADGSLRTLAQLLVSLGCERHCRIVSAIGTFGCALISRARRLSACSSRSATPVETVHPLGNPSIPRRPPKAGYPAHSHVGSPGPLFPIPRVRQRLCESAA